jgi:hypothetical protein
MSSKIASLCARNLTDFTLHLSPIDFGLAISIAFEKAKNTLFFIFYLTDDQTS